jgi:hypothetical protein
VQKAANGHTCGRFVSADGWQMSTILSAGAVWANAGSRPRSQHVMIPTGSFLDAKAGRWGKRLLAEANRRVAPPTSHPLPSFRCIAIISPVADGVAGLWGVLVANRTLFLAFCGPTLRLLLPSKRGRRKNGQWGWWQDGFRMGVKLPGQTPQTQAEQRRSNRVTHEALRCC